MIIDGRELAKEVLASTKVRAERLAKAPRVVAIVANETPATRSYLSIKKRRAADAGCELIVREFPSSVSTNELIMVVAEETAGALIVQLPLPVGVSTDDVCNAIPVSRDPDVLSRKAQEAFLGATRGSLLPPVVSAVKKILEHSGVAIAGKHVVVVGQGRLVGAPVASWLTSQGATVVSLGEGSPLTEELLRADIIVTGAGVPGLVRPDMVRPGVVLIDAGTSEAAGVIAGDIDPACAEKAAVFTPVPGGVGPLAVACLFENAVLLAEGRTF